MITRRLAFLPALFALAALASAVAAAGTISVQPGPLQLPAEYRSDRQSTQFFIADKKIVTAVDIAGEGCVRHFWTTFAHADSSTRAGLDVIMRIYADGRDVPDVEMPVSTFFCQFHGLAPAGVSSPFLQVTDRGGFNSYFPIPFSNGLKITLENQTGGDADLYFQADFQRYDAGTLTEPMRFHAVYRRVNPARRYDEPYLLGWGRGRGFLAGAAIGMRVFDRVDAWYHHGGDRILIDGATANPSMLNGIGGEDFFGNAYGMGAYSNGPIGCLYYIEKDKAPKFVNIGQEESGTEGRRASIDREPYLTFSAYRFFDPDTIVFRNDFSVAFGSAYNDMASVLYWYQEGEAAPVTRLPSAADRDPEARVPEGKYDAPLPVDRRWDVCGPFPAATREEFEQPEFPEERIDFGEKREADFGVYKFAFDNGSGRVYTKWTRDVPELLHFVDLRPYHPTRIPTNFGFPFDVAAYATTTVTSAEERDVRLRIGHDDWLRIWLNGVVVYDGAESIDFRSAEIPAHLKAGDNRVTIKAANRQNLNLRAWIYQFDILDSEAE